jgi:hypothetical protein
MDARSARHPWRYKLGLHCSRHIYDRSQTGTWSRRNRCSRVPTFSPTHIRILGVMSTQPPSTSNTTDTEEAPPSSVTNDDGASATTDADPHASPTAYETTNALFMMVNILAQGNLPPQRQIPCYRMIWQCFRLLHMFPEIVPDPDEDLKFWEMKCWADEDVSDWDVAKTHGLLYDMYKKAAQVVKRSGTPAWQG